MILRVVVALVAGLALSGCAQQECSFHSQCGTQRYCSFGRCEQDCRMDFDCPTGRVCSEIGQCVAPFDAGPMPDAGPEVDAFVPPGTDAGPRPDAFVPPVDAFVPPVDAFVPPTPDAGPRGRYLDPCLTADDCVTGRCVDDTGGARRCSIACTTHRDCASEHVCSPDGVCVPDDTGTTCSAAASCVLGLCAGNPAAGFGHCTRPCVNAGDCPAGYACSNAGGTFICVDIEKPCSTPQDCATGFCLTDGRGCTAECRSAADCPRRFGFLPQYTCQSPGAGMPARCILPGDIAGSDPIGASCPAVGDSTCRSGGCDSAAPTGPMCTQACTHEGGCAAGFGCFPSPEDLSGDGTVDTLVLLCARAGSRAIGETCSSGQQCASGLCDTSGYCTRLCTTDGLCPSDMRCDPVTGFAESICRR